jgi:hypothetical protein
MFALKFVFIWPPRRTLFMMRLLSGKEGEHKIGGQASKQYCAITNRLLRNPFKKTALSPL